MLISYNQKFCPLLFSFSTVFFYILEAEIGFQRRGTINSFEIHMGYLFYFLLSISYAYTIAVLVTDVFSVSFSNGAVSVNMRVTLKVKLDEGLHFCNGYNN